MSVATLATPSSDGVLQRVAAVRGWLATVDGAEIGDADRVSLLSELEALKATAAAAQARVTAAYAASHTADLIAAGAPIALARRAVGSQVALARRESPTRGDQRVGAARALTQEMPATLTALTEGRISEWVATIMVRETAVLTLEHRAAVDARLAGDLPRLSATQVARAARRVSAELDAAAIVARIERAVAARRVSIRPAADGMAYLTVLGPLHETVGAYAALRAHADAVVTGQAAEEPAGRGRSAVMADTALQRLSGRATGQAQPVEIQLVMTDRALLGVGDPTRATSEPAHLPGHGPVPASQARAWAADPAAAVWVRRLYTTPDGRDLTATDSRRRLFTGGLRRMLVLRDQTCRTPYCDAPIVDADHTAAHHAGGPTTLANATGLCQRCHHTKDTPGWRVDTISAEAPGSPPHTIEVTTPTGHRHRSTAPPILGWGWSPPEPASPLEAHLRRLLNAA